MTSQRYSDIVSKSHVGSHETTQWFRACKEVSLTCFIIGLVSGGIFGGSITNFYFVPLHEQALDKKSVESLLASSVIPSLLSPTTTSTAKITKPKPKPTTTTTKRTTTTKPTTTTTKPTTTTTTMTTTTTTATTTLPKTARARWTIPYKSKWKNCEDVYESGFNKSNVYHVTVMKQKIEVFCNMDNGGGWTMFQRREDGSVKFDRSWSDYKEGFGNTYGEFWLGNKWLSAMTKRTQLLRVHLLAFSGEFGFAEFNDFRVQDEKTNFTLKIRFRRRSNNDNAFGAFVFYLYDKQQFKTKDRWTSSCTENKKPIRCSDLYGNGGWWFKENNEMNLNGIYSTKREKNDRNIFWLGLDNKYPILVTELMFRSPKFKG